MILVTGGAGYIGSVLVRELLALGERVRVVDTLWFGNPFPPHERLEVDRRVICAIPSQPGWTEVDAIIHLAGLSNDPTADFAPELNSESNVYATRQLAELAAAKARRDDKPMRYLFASTCSVYYAPTTADEANVTVMTEDMPIAPTANYSKTKRLAEVELLRIADQNPLFVPVLLRKGTIFGLGPRMRFDLVVNVFTLARLEERSSSPSTGTARPGVRCCTSATPPTPTSISSRRRWRRSAAKPSISSTRTTACSSWRTGWPR